MPGRIVARALGMAVGCVLTAAGCQGQGTPEGFTEGKTTHVSIAYPKNWKRVPPDQVPGRKPALLAQLTEGREEIAQLAVVDSLAKATGADLGVRVAQTWTQFWPGYRQLGTGEEIDVPGADEARRLAFVYTTEERGGGEPQARGIDVVAVQDRDVQVVRITWLPGEVDEDVIDDIVASVQLREQ